MTYTTNDFPTSVQNPSSPLGTEQVATFDHAGLETFQNASIKALKDKVGADGSAVQTSHDYKLGEVTGADKAVGKSATQTLTNKTLTSPTISNPTITGAVVNAPLTRPRITTSIDDANGNEVIKTPATSSAVNEITITNSATGNDVEVSATGDDTNIGLKIKAKGSGKVKLGTAELQMPNADGSSGQVLTTNGTGVLSFATVSTERFNIGGDGSDGDVTISSGTTTLTRDMYYNNLTVNGTGILNTAGYRVFVRGTLTADNTSGAVIRNNGGNGGNASGSTAGSAGSAASSGSLPGGIAGQIGAAGVSGSGTDGLNGIAGTNADKSVGVAGVAGGAGGGGDNSGSNPGGAGGTAGSKTGTVLNNPRSMSNAVNLFDFTSSTAVQRIIGSAGSGSGGGGGVGVSGGNGGAGGGSGAPGGWVYIEAKILNLTGTGVIQANGGTGGNGSSGTGTTAGGGGGGAGGSGGVIIAVYQVKQGTGTIVANGGIGGTGGGFVGPTAAAGNTGTTGLSGAVFEIKVTE